MCQVSTLGQAYGLPAFSWVPLVCMCKLLACVIDNYMIPAVSHRRGLQFQLACTRITTLKQKYRGPCAASTAEQA
jgi:hypothetical protein